MRIVHLTSSVGLGGAERMLIDLVKVLRVDHEQCVLTFSDGHFAPQFRALGIAYKEVSLWGVYRTVLNFKPDLIHCWLPKANIVGTSIGRLLGIPVLVSMHATPTIEGRMRTLLSWVYLPHAVRIVAVSQRAFQAYGLAAFAGRARVIANGIDTARFMPASREEYGHDSAHQGMVGTRRSDTDAFVVGTVARLVPEKRVGLLLAACAQVYRLVPSLRIIIVGWGTARQELECTARELGLADRVLFVETDEPHMYLRKMDCFVQPCAVEGMGIAVLEAMCCRVPCVVATLPGQNHPVIVDGQTGFVCSALTDDALIESMARAIIHVHSEEILAKKIAGNAYTMIHGRYSIDLVAREYEQVYQELVLKL